MGLFLLNKDKKNYTEAISSCQRWGGDLAHVLSEPRTNALSNVILNEIQEWYKAAYVGLDDTRFEGLFQTPLGAPLDCVKYRAWAPGHPRNKSRRDDCVILDHEKNWKVVNCKHRLPFICELYPEKIIPEDNFTERPNCTNLQDESKYTQCRLVAPFTDLWGRFKENLRSACRNKRNMSCFKTHQELIFVPY